MLNKFKYVKQRILHGIIKLFLDNAVTCPKVFLWPDNRNNVRKRLDCKTRGVISQMLVKGISCPGGCTEATDGLCKKITGALNGSDLEMGRNKEKSDAVGDEGWV